MRSSVGVAVALAVLGLVLPAAAQAPPRVPSIGFIVQGPAGCAATSREEAFVQALRDLGYAPGQNVVIDRRCYANTEEIPAVMRAIVARPVDIIIAGAPVQASAARQTTKTIPIVCASCGDPVANGLVVSLARPARNVTGLASLSAELIGKRVALLKELLPGISRVAAFIYPSNPGTPLTVPALEEASRATGLKLHLVKIHATNEYDGAFRSAAAAGAGAVLLQDDPLGFSGRAQIAALGLQYRLPVSTGIIETAEAGGLMAYGPNRVEMYRRAAVFADKLLKGAQAGDLPFEQASKIDLVINVKTAKALGVTIPPSVLLRADRVIE